MTRTTDTGLRLGVELSGILPERRTVPTKCFSEVEATKFGVSVLTDGIINIGVGSASWVTGTVAG